MRSIFFLVLIFSLSAQAILTPVGSGNATQLQGVPVSASSPSSGNCLVFSAGSWAGASCLGSAATISGSNVIFNGNIIGGQPYGSGDLFVLGNTTLTGGHYGGSHLYSGNPGTNNGFDATDGGVSIFGDPLIYAETTHDCQIVSDNAGAFSLSGFSSASFPNATIAPTSDVVSLSVIGGGNTPQTSDILQVHLNDGTKSFWVDGSGNSNAAGTMIAGAIQDQGVAFSSFTAFDSSGTLTSTNPAINFVAYFPSLLSGDLVGGGIAGQNATMSGIAATASVFSCTGNPTITFYDCGADATCATSPTTLGSVTVTSANSIIGGTTSGGTISAGDYYAFKIAGTCATFIGQATAWAQQNP